MNCIRSGSFGIALALTCTAVGQQSYYNGRSITGQLRLMRTVNALQQANRPLGASRAKVTSTDEGLSRVRPQALRPPLVPNIAGAVTVSGATASPAMASLPVLLSNTFGFNGLTHLDQRLSNGGNQFSVEPPNPSVAVGNGFVLQGVNNAIQVYTVAGTPILPRVLSTNELFGVAPAIDRATNINGVYPTDMRVFFDHGIARWFVLQRAQDYDAFGNARNSSRMYMAVSQGPDPTGSYSIYEMDTTNPTNPGCPCIADYPQIGADQYGFYVSFNEFDAYSIYFTDVAVLAISKADLARGELTPITYRFLIPPTDGFAFTVHPATTPPGASYYVASGGLEYFVSSQASYSVYDRLAVWAMYNTASLNTTNPSLLLTRITTPTLTYRYPNLAVQQDGPLAYGSTLIPPGKLAYIDGGDCRIQSVVYSGGRLYTTLGTAVVDEGGRTLVGGAYVILSPTMRSNVLAAPLLRQGYILAKGINLLRPAIAVNAQGRGAIAFTLVGPGYYPSAAFLPIEAFSTGAAIQLAARGMLPEDGFTGYPGGVGAGIARWGDYSGAVVGTDGSTWMVVEHIPNAPRTEFANWGTYLARYTP